MNHEAAHKVVYTKRRSEASASERLKQWIQITQNETGVFILMTKDDEESKQL